MAVRLGSLQEGDLFFYVAKDGDDTKMAVGEVRGHNYNTMTGKGVTVFKTEDNNLDELSADAMVTTD